MNENCASASAIGYMSYALGLWITGVSEARWAHGSPAAIGAMTLPLAILLLIAGVLCFMGKRGLDSIVFLGGAAYLWSDHSLVLLFGVPQVSPPPAFIGWFDISWAVFFGLAFIAAFEAHRQRTLFLLVMTVRLLAYAIEHWSGAHAILTIAGYLGLATALLAGIISAKEIMTHLRANAGEERGSVAPGPDRSGGLGVHRMS